MGNAAVIDQGFGIFTVDTGFKRAGLVAAHVLVEGGRAALVDVGVTPAVDRVRAALDGLGVDRAAVDWVMVTHVHLDHAGAAGVLLRELPNARLVVHPRGAPHMIDPSRLIAGATAVYGEAEMAASFGEIAPAPEDRVVQVNDGDVLNLNGRDLLFLDTPGHAKHHYCVFDARSRGFFTGDTFGLSYREFDNERGPWMFPTTTPVQFDPHALHHSIERLLDHGPERMFLTHFGCVAPPRPLADQLHEHIDALAALALDLEAEPAGAARQERLRQGVERRVLDSLRAHGCTLPETRILDLMAMDIELNAQGLESWLEYRRKAASR